MFVFLRRRVPENGPLKAAVIGAGAFGRHHAAKYDALPGVDLIAIVDPNAEARRAIPAAYGAQALADWRNLPGKVDLVSICSPAVTHADLARTFLNAGAHVLVEKPIATSAEDANGLVRLSRETGRVLTAGHQERFVFARLGLLDQSEVPLDIRCWRKGPWTGRGADVSAVFDLMIHDLDLVHTLVPGALADIQAHGRVKFGPYVDEAAALLRFANGTIARLETSRVADSRSRGMRAIYADGVVEIDFITRKVTNTTPRALSALEMGDPLGESVASFVYAAQTGTEPLVRAEQACRAVETAALIEDAVETALPARRTGSFLHLAAAR
jgi:predicted dehydrogenase